MATNKKIENTIPADNGANISEDAQDLEEMFYAEDNAYAGQIEDDSEAEAKEGEQKQTEPENSDEEQKKSDAINEKILEELFSPEQAFQQMMKQPFEIVMENMKIDEDEFVKKCEELFAKGHFTYNIKILNVEIELRSKNIHDHIDFAAFLRMILQRDDISQREYETLRQARQLVYAIKTFNGEDWTKYDIEERWEKVQELDELVVSMIINASEKFWKISNLMLHPGVVDFLQKRPQK